MAVLDRRGNGTHPLAAYVVLAYAISWTQLIGAIVLVTPRKGRLGFASSPVPPTPALKEATTP